MLIKNIAVLEMEPVRKSLYLFVLEPVYENLLW